MKGKIILFKNMVITKQALFKLGNTLIKIVARLKADCPIFSRKELKNGRWIRKGLMQQKLKFLTVASTFWYYLVYLGEN